MAMEIFSEYVEHLLKYINHTALLQEWKLNIDAADYKGNIDANLYKPSEKKKLIVMIVTCTGHIFSPLCNILKNYERIKE